MIVFVFFYGLYSLNGHNLTSYIFYGLFFLGGLSFNNSEIIIIIYFVITKTKRGLIVSKL